MLVCDVPEGALFRQGWWRPKGVDCDCVFRRGPMRTDGHDVAVEIVKICETCLCLLGPDGCWGTLVLGRNPAIYDPLANELEEAFGC